MRRTIDVTVRVEVEDDLPIIAPGAARVGLELYLTEEQTTGLRGMAKRDGYLGAEDDAVRPLVRAALQVAYDAAAWLESNPRYDPRCTCPGGPLALLGARDSLGRTGAHHNRDCPLYAGDLYIG